MLGEIYFVFKSLSVQLGLPLPEALLQVGDWQCSHSYIQLSSHHAFLINPQSIVCK